MPIICQAFKVPLRPHWSSSIRTEQCRVQLIIQSQYMVFLPNPIYRSSALPKRHESLVDRTRAISKYLGQLAAFGLQLLENKMARLDKLAMPCLEKGACTLSRRDFIKGGCSLASALSFSGSAKAETKDGTAAIGDASLSTRVLLVYNTNSSDSVAIKDYYVSNRPGMGSVDTLGVAADTAEKTTPANLVSQIRTPIYNFLSDSPNKKYYVIMCRGFSSRVWSEGKAYASVDYLLSRADPNLSNSVGREYNGRINFQISYAPTTFPGTAFLVTRLDMGSLAATRAYINKIKRVCAAMSTPSLAVSAQSAGLGGTNYLLDEVRGAAYQGYALIAIDAKISKIRHSHRFRKSDLHGHRAQCQKRQGRSRV